MAVKSIRTRASPSWIEKDSATPLRSAIFRMIVMPRPTPSESGDLRNVPCRNPAEAATGLRISSTGPGRSLARTGPVP